MGLLLVPSVSRGRGSGALAPTTWLAMWVNQGLWSLWYAVNTLLALALVGCFFAVPFGRPQVRTVAEVFRRRFGSRRCQVLTRLCV